MVECGQKVLYGMHGVCCILDTETRVIDRKNVEYFVLEPDAHPGARYYIPTQNQAALAKLQPLLTREELEELVNSDEVNKDIWISDENLRRQRYKEMLNNCDRVALLCMIRTLRKHKILQLEAGKKFHLSDEGFLKDAEKMLASEFSFVLNMTVQETMQYINKIVE